MTDEVEPPVALPVEQEWLQNILNNKYGTDEQIVSVECTIIGEGKGFASTMTQVDITYSGSSDKLPSKIVIKIPTKEKIEKMTELKKVLDIDPKLLEKIHEAEVNAYSFFTEFGQDPIPMAKFIHGQKYEGGQQGLLILEFVEGRSLTFLEDNTVDQLKVLVGHIAHLQAYGIRYAKGDGLHNAAIAVFEPMFAQGGEMYPKLQAAAPDLFPFDQEHVIAAVDFGRKLASDAVNGKLPYKGVVCLSDIQPNNILWKVDGDGNIKDEVAAFVDYQGCHMNRCACDITALMFWGLSAGQRTAHEDEILDHYYNVLSEQAGDKVPLSFPELKQEYQEALICSMCMFIPFLAAADDMKQVLGFTDERVRELRMKVATILEDWVQSRVSKDLQHAENTV